MERLESQGGAPAILECCNVDTASFAVEVKRCVLLAKYRSEETKLLPDESANPVRVLRV